MYSEVHLVPPIPLLLLASTGDTLALLSPWGDLVLLECSVSRGHEETL